MRLYSIRPSCCAIKSHPNVLVLALVVTVSGNMNLEKLGLLLRGLLLRGLLMGVQGRLKKWCDSEAKSAR